MNRNISTLLNRAMSCRDKGEALQLLRAAVKVLEEEMRADAENAAINERYAKMAVAGVDPRVLHYHP